MTRSRRALLPMSAPLLLLPLLACVALPGVDEIDSFTLSDEWRLGGLLEEQLRLRLPVLADVEAQELLGELAAPLTAAGPLGDRSWRVLLLDDGDAFTLHAPGGRVFVSAGLLRLLDDEGVARGLIAHEIAHAQLRHGTLQLVQAHGASVVLAASRGERAAVLQDLAANLAAGGAFARFGEAAEREADATAADLLSRSGGDVEALDRARRLRTPGDSARRPSRLATCHPPPRPSRERARDSLRAPESDAVGARSSAFHRLRERLAAAADAH